MTTRPCLICVLLVITVAMKCGTEQIMNFDKLEYLIAELEEAPETLTLNASGQALFEVHTNQHKPDHPEIGIYETKLADAELGQLRSRLSTPPFATQADNSGKVMPSDRYKRIRVTAGSEKVEKLYGSKGPIPSSVRDLIDYLDQLIIEVSRHPRQTLRSELSEVQVNAEKLFTATLTLSNSGNQSTWCRHPASMLSASDGDLSLETWPDTPSVSAADVMTFAVKKVTAVQSAGTDKVARSVIEIPSGGAVAFRLEAQFPTEKAGTYLIRVRYQSLVQRLEGYQLVYGEVYSRTTKVNVP